MDSPDTLALSLADAQLQPSEESPPTTLNDLPTDILRIILKPLSKVGDWGNGSGGISNSRLVSKRMQQAVESCATHITFDYLYGCTFGLPSDALSRCSNIQHIMMGSTNLESLDGVPSTLKTLYVIGMPYRQMYLMEGGPVGSLGPLATCLGLEVVQLNDASAIDDISPLASCTKMKSLTLHDSRVTIINAVSSMPLLENLSLTKDKFASRGCCHIEDLSPLLECKKLQRLNLIGNDLSKDNSTLGEIKKRFQGITLQL